MIATIAPHWAEYVWLEILKKVCIPSILQTESAAYLVSFFEIARKYPLFPLA